MWNELAGISSLSVTPKSPADFHLDGCRFLTVEAQLATGLAFARACPLRHYARKNIGYLLAIREGAARIVETDDDNLPRPRVLRRSLTPVHRSRFGKRRLGECLPLRSQTLSSGRAAYRSNSVQIQPTPLTDLAVADADCPIQQGLADENPDVDAIYRFDPSSAAIISCGCAGCPWRWLVVSIQQPEHNVVARRVFHCYIFRHIVQFRMTDIWRSFVAQRIAWENGWSVLFHEPTLWQQRNEHDLMRDFEDEVVGYLNNRRIGAALARLPLKAGVAHLANNLRACYSKMVEMDIVGRDELPLLEAWLADLELS